jgi:hypothetical protein
MKARLQDLMVFVAILAASYVIGELLFYFIAITGGFK